MPKLANPNRSEPRFKIKAHLNFEAKLTNIILLTKPHSCKVLGNEIRKIGYRIIWGWEILYQNWSNPVIALSERLGWPDLNRPISAFLFTCYVLGYGWQKFRWYFVHIWPLLFHKKSNSFFVIWYYQRRQQNMEGHPPVSRKLYKLC